MAYALLSLCLPPTRAQEYQSSDYGQHVSYKYLEIDPLARPYPFLRKAVHCRPLMEQFLRPSAPPKSPPRRIPPPLLPQYTLNHTVQLRDWWYDSSDQAGSSLPNHFWGPSACTKVLSKAQAATLKKQKYSICVYRPVSYGEWGCDVLHFLAKHAEKLKGKVVVVLGSETPWIECQLLRLGARVTTVDPCAYLC